MTQIRSKMKISHHRRHYASGIQVFWDVSCVAGVVPDVSKDSLAFISKRYKFQLFLNGKVQNTFFRKSFM